MTRIRDIVFPIIVYTYREDFIYAFSSIKEFTVADKKLVEQGVFNDTYIIAASGMRYEIAEIINKGWATSFWGYSLIIKGRQIKVDFELKFIENISLEELKHFASERVERDREKWDNLGVTADEILTSVSNAQSHKELISVFY